MISADDAYRLVCEKRGPSVEQAKALLPRIAAEVEKAAKEAHVRIRFTCGSLDVADEVGKMLTVLGYRTWFDIVRDPSCVRSGTIAIEWGPDTVEPGAVE